MAQQNQDKMKKVLLWVTEQREEHPSLTLNAAFRKAEINFDLTPKECAFIERNFTKTEDCT